MTFLQRLAASAIRRLGPLLHDTYPDPVPLSAEHIERCRVVENRYALLRLLPNGAVCAEVGIAEGTFSAAILLATKPSRLHLIDIDSEIIAKAAERFRPEIERGIVELHHGDSSTVLRSFPERTFDWVYIDADHRYETVQRDLEAARAAVKPDGYIVANDYTSYDPLGMLKYGVVEAVNAMCRDHGYEILAFAFEPRMFCDVVLGRRGIARGLGR
ncbi:MAG: class I SAM-dependent methyltransferase [Bacteroidota bacterium]|nr:class I SAM-dependent methyltransferase [Bacteroidota bacterium]